MSKKQFELTQEQHQEIIDKMTTRSFYGGDADKHQKEVESDAMASDGLFTNEIASEPIPQMAEQVQTEAESPVTEVADKIPPTSVVEEQPSATTIQRRVSSKQRKLSLEEYRNTFMRPYRIEDRKPVFISGKLRKMLDKFACKIGEDRMSMSGLLENIVRHHIELYADDFEHWKGM